MTEHDFETCDNTSCPVEGCPANTDVPVPARWRCSCRGTVTPHPCPACGGFGDPDEPDESDQLQAKLTAEEWSAPVGLVERTERRVSRAGIREMGMEVWEGPKRQWRVYIYHLAKAGLVKKLGPFLAPQAARDAGDKWVTAHPDLLDWGLPENSKTTTAQAEYALYPGGNEPDVQTLALEALETASSKTPSQTGRKNPPSIEEAKAAPFGWFNHNKRWKHPWPDNYRLFELSSSLEGDKERFWFDEWPSEAWGDIGGEWYPCLPPSFRTEVATQGRALAKAWSAISASINGSASQAGALDDLDRLARAILDAPTPVEVQGTVTQIVGDEETSEITVRVPTPTIEDIRNTYKLDKKTVTLREEGK